MTTAADAAFRAALSRFASGVVIVTTRDGAGKPHGFTATSFCSVSLDPPLVLVCLARSARCHPVFARAEAFAISVLRHGQEPVARRFASRAADKFADGDLETTAHGSVVPAGALAVLECDVAQRQGVGDHTLLVGRVVSVPVTAPGAPAVYFDRSFTTLSTEGR
ncbi:flavin reductase family protein [Streptomyces sp. DSM 44917]|uniref:Flavin reductase family protein n=1 Tax=Streptomyces boetiae TaxID=3075541 RepID=A0ABU2L4K0_9ACTN|nr:flavin reductase family protein [Streptomyces sp. DSM 44917]MDT0306490.1 flavin reductase family protein [Streptomyces sp. DSM 44917]